MSYRKGTTFPQYDTKLNPDAEKGQIGILHNVEKRHNILVTKLPKWGHKGVTIDIIRAYLNKLLGANFNRRHIEYALEGLVKHGVIGKRSNGEEATYYAFPTTADRWAKTRVLLRGK